MVKWVTLWFNLGFSLKTLVAPLQPELFTVSVSWNDRTYCHSPWMGCQFIRGAPPSPTFLQFSLTVHKWPLILLSGEGPGESKVPSSRTLQREFESWHFDPESRVRSPGSGVRGPESGVRSPGSGVRGPGSRVQNPESRVQICHSWFHCEIDEHYWGEANKQKFIWYR